MGNRRLGMGIEKWLRIKIRIWTRVTIVVTARVD